MRDPILVGELNPYGPNPEFALYCDPPNSAGGRLQRLVLGLHPSTYLAVPRENLCDFKWSAPLARARAARIADEGGLVIALGSKVAAAFGLPFTPCEQHDIGVAVVVVLPHPSGLNRMWADVTLIPRCRKALVDAGCALPFGEVVP